MTFRPRCWAVRENSLVLAGERCAELTSMSYGMPNSSRALAASFMISRSLSLPMMMATCDVLIYSPHESKNVLLLLQTACCDVFPIVHTFETDLPHGFVREIDGATEIGSSGSDAE